jgi:hypothetical protein
MAEPQKESGDSPKPESQKPKPGKPTKPKRKHAARTAVGKSRAAPPGRGAARLRRAVNSAVDEKSAQIADALVNQALGGSAAGARLLVNLAGAHHPAALQQKKKKRRGLSQAQLLALEPEWQPPITGANPRNLAPPGESKS